HVLQQLQPLHGRRSARQGLLQQRGVVGFHVVVLYLRRLLHLLSAAAPIGRGSPSPGSGPGSSLCSLPETTWLPSRTRGNFTKEPSHVEKDLHAQPGRPPGGLRRGPAPARAGASRGPSSAGAGRSGDHAAPSVQGAGYRGGG